MNPINEILEQHSNSEQIEKSSRRFDFKPYHLKYKGLKILSKIAAYTLPLVSIVTGSLWLASVMQNIIPFSVMAIVVGALLVVGLEYLKNYLLNIGLTDAYNGIRTGLVSVLIGSSLAVVSGFISLRGIENLNNTLDKSVSNLEATHVAKRDSLANYYDAQIQQTQSDLKAFEASVSYNGKINIYNQPTAKKLESFDNRLNALEEQKTKSLEALTNTQTSQINILNESNGFALSIVLIIIGSIEVLILISNWYIIYYDFRVKKESDSLIQHSEQPSFTIPEFQRLYQSGFQLASGFQATTNDLSTHINTNDTGIGFQPQNLNTDDLSRINTGIKTTEQQQKLLDYLEKYSFVVEDLEAKELSYIKIAQKYNISKSTVQNVSRCLRTVKAYEWD